MRGTKKIDWLNHFLEFIVVVIGILLAFQLNTCREEQKEEKLVNEHIENIIKESQFNQGNLKSSIANTERKISVADTLLHAIVSNESLQKINGLSFQLLGEAPSYIKKTAYNSLKDSGDIRFISDFELKNDLITLYEYYEWAAGMDQAAFSTFEDYYYPYTIKNFDLISASVQEEPVYKAKEFKNIISGYYYILKAKRNQNKETLEKIESFLKKQGVTNE